MKFKTEQELLVHCLKGNEDAIDLVNTLSRISQVIDDLYDGDISNELVSRRSNAKHLAWDVLINLPRNLFYTKYFAELQPVIELGINDWLAANAFEERAPYVDDHLHLMQIAHVIRDNVYSIVATCARIIGGHQWAAEVSPILREFVHSESFEDYINERAPK